MAKPEWIGDASNPEIFESPRMFRHEQDLYLVARTDPKGPFMSDNPLNLPPTLHHLYDLASYREEAQSGGASLTEGFSHAQIEIGILSEPTDCK